MNVKKYISIKTDFKLHKLIETSSGKILVGLEEFPIVIIQSDNSTSTRENSKNCHVRRRHVA